MAVMTPVVQSPPLNRRRRVRHKIQTPAYASFPNDSSGKAMLNLHEIVDISEDGISLQCHSPLEPDRKIDLCLDLAGSSEQIYTTGLVIWSNASGRTGLRFSDLPPASLFRLRDWLFLNAMAGVANADEAAVARSSAALQVPLRPSYTDTLAAVTAVQREVEALAADLPAALNLIAARAQTLLRASGAALALADSEPGYMMCVASAGHAAPPVGTRLQVGSGFSGDCVRSGRLLRCDNAEFDPRVDQDICRVLGIRSILACPIRAREKSIGLLEAFSPELEFFTETHTTVLQRLAETVLAAVNRSARARDLPLPGSITNTAVMSQPGGVLFAAPAAEVEDSAPAMAEDTEHEGDSGVSLPRSLSVLLILAGAVSAAVAALALGYGMAPWIQAKLRQRDRMRVETVLASSQPPKTDNAASTPGPVLEGATIPQLQQMAASGNAAAENELGLRYFEGDRAEHIARDEREAFRWFSKAAEDGNMAAQSKLGFLYKTGTGVPRDLYKAYFWSVLARSYGDEGNKQLAADLATHMTRSQAARIEQEADLWLHYHLAGAKPNAGLRN
jgi:GAF domain/PilZ domain/Sel1 repeat